MPSGKNTADNAKKPESAEMETVSPQMRINDTTYTFILNGDTITITEASGANSYTMTRK